MSVPWLCVCNVFDGTGMNQFQRKILRQREMESILFPHNFRTGIFSSFETSEKFRQKV